ncbi:hypothetical protein VOLCADRAFT_107764 [Volvox carteri f. nagariensis]|uniref:Uncharacterized protein n=1 Tax=Volvox carteri f. nagariensis TaxID=3068 RepID=D8UG82_VOLCA|nr:uncharacterized protein VOLCADRAFT_107764 [Volvox carteri f. nagariensis]EFJ41243.1 hypothetical protein VOLCADRAFT_107764 [Volvox carteri f. nagariensis]|eukprot:XP_002957694.1 hypothetical protein VOLCADRAFT_107764 [Volvox carteri f. nagariensis]
MRSANVATRRSGPARLFETRARRAILAEWYRLSLAVGPGHRPSCQTRTVCPCSGPAEPAPQLPSAVAPDHAPYQALLSELAPLSPQQLRVEAHRRPSQLLDVGFLFWLRDQERRPGLRAIDRELLSRLGQELTMMREWTEEQSNRTLLPSLASSLAYGNLRQWREETGAEAPEVVPGVPLEQLYRLGEEEERKLRESLRGGGGGGTGPRRVSARSGIEEFTKYNKAYADLAAGAVARVRQRLMGFDDDGPSAASAVLRALLRQMGSPEERANSLPEAFSPPGLQVLPDDATATGAIGQGGGKPSFFMTTPAALMAAARTRLGELTGADEGGIAALSLGTPDAAVALVEAGSAASGRTLPEGGRGWPGLLPSGEDEVTVLEELLQLIDQYDKQVYSRKTPLERMGHTPGPWASTLQAPRPGPLGPNLNR